VQVVPAIIAVATYRPPTDRSGYINLLPKCKLYFWCQLSTFCSPLILL